MAKYASLDAPDLSRPRESLTRHRAVIGVKLLNVVGWSVTIGASNFVCVGSLVVLENLPGHSLVGL